MARRGPPANNRRRLLETTNYVMSLSGLDLSMNLADMPHEKVLKCCPYTPLAIRIESLARGYEHQTANRLRLCAALNRRF